jgi:hypothetical protein
MYLDRPDWGQQRRFKRASGTVCTAIAERATTISLMMEESEKNDDRNWNS